MGDYGYYIYAFSDGKFDNPSDKFTPFGDKRSIVLAFEIKYEQVGDISEARDAFGIEIKPLFRREYATLMVNGINEVGIGDHPNGTKAAGTLLISVRTFLRIK